MFRSIVSSRRRLAGLAPAAVLVAVLAIGGCSSSSAGSSSTSRGTGSKESFCTLLLAFRVSNDSLDGEITSGDPATAKSAFERLVEQVKLLQQRAPADIKPDVDTTATFLGQFEALLAKYSYDLTTLSADPAAAEQFATLNSSAVQASLDQLRSYGDTDCATTVTSTTLTP